MVQRIAASREHDERFQRQRQHEDAKHLTVGDIFVGPNLTDGGDPTAPEFIAEKRSAVEISGDVPHNVKRNGRTEIGVVQRYDPGREAEDAALVESLNKRVSVAFGRFNQTLQTKDINCLTEEEEHKYYAPGLGLVLTVTLEDGREQRGSERLELIRVRTADDEDDQDNADN